MDGTTSTENQNTQRCEICGKGVAVWVSIWVKGHPRFTPILENVRYPGNASKLCDNCKEVSSTRFRP